MSSHTLQLANEPFQAILSGKKTVESRLYDEKRRTIKLGDIITFINRENPEHTVRVEVVGLLRYRNFVTMFEHNNPAKFGGSNADWLINQINQFYTLVEQEKFGVIGIEFQIV